jgi:DNA repair protein RadA/Sms
MAKDKSQFVCRECGHAHAKWQGQCDGCGSWNCLEELGALPMSRKGQAPTALAPSGKAVRLSDVQAEELPRISTGSDEFDRVLGGGLVPGGVVLIGGDPGIGKSTLLLQALVGLSQMPGGSVLMKAP